MRDTESSSAARRCTFSGSPRWQLQTKEMNEQLLSSLKVDQNRLMEDIHYVPVGYRREVGEVRHDFNVSIQRRLILATSGNISGEPQCSWIYAGK